MSWEMHEAAKKIADGWYSELEATRKRNAVLGRENANLRKLVAEMFNACPMCVNCAHNHLTVGWYDRMRALGVEVD